MVRVQVHVSHPKSQSQRRKQIQMKMEGEKKKKKQKSNWTAASFVFSVIVTSSISSSSSSSAAAAAFTPSSTGSGTTSSSIPYIQRAPLHFSSPSPLSPSSCPSSCLFATATPTATSKSISTCNTISNNVPLSSSSCTLTCTCTLPSLKNQNRPQDDPIIQACGGISATPTSSSIGTSGTKLKSFISGGSGGGSILGSCQNRYGGRTSTSNFSSGNVVTVVDHANRQIHFRRPGLGLGGADRGRNRVLGFDLKMVSPSVEENCGKNHENSDEDQKQQLQLQQQQYQKLRKGSNKSTNGQRQAQGQEQKQKQKQTKSKASSSTSSSTSDNSDNSHSRSRHVHGNWIGIDALDVDASNMSPIKKQIASNLLQRTRRNKAAIAAAVAAGSLSSREYDINSSTSSSSSSSTRRTNILEFGEGKGGEMGGSRSGHGGKMKTGSSNVPMWFPYIPTRQQIESLKVVELKDACNERGLSKTGNKLDLQQRLLQWTHDQHKRRVLERNALRMSTAHPLHDAIDQALHSNGAGAGTGAVAQSFDSYLSSSFDAFSSAAAASAASASRRERRKVQREQDEKQKKKGQVSASTSTTSDQGNDSDGVDTIEPLINRRKALLRSKQFSFSKNKKGVLGFDIDTINDSGSDTPQNDSVKERDNDESSLDDEEEEEEEEYDELFMLPTKDYLSGLTKTFHDSKSVPAEASQDAETMDVDVMNNYQLKELYLQAKYADQNGDTNGARMMLQKLHMVTPNDTRIIRRLARLEIQENNYHKGREILQTGLRMLPNDSYLLHGLGQLERKCGNFNKARDYFKEAIQTSPKIPNPYHALGTLEHSQGNIRAATTVLRMGLKQCPSNHRLHHALGDLYREAKMLDMAEKAYLRGLKCLDVESSDSGRPLNWSRSFFYTAMSYLSYDRGDKESSRNWLKKSINLVNKRMHAQGWLGLAQLEESEGNIEAARKIYHEGLSFYEKYRGINKKLRASSRSMLGANRKSQVKPSKLGDQWLSVYESLARLEERHGDYYSANNVYSRAATAFPNNWNILFSWSQLQRKHGRYNDRSRTLLNLSCGRAGASDSEPYRLYAELEMSMGNYNRARSILFHGAQSYSESSDGSLSNDKFARLYHTWAICEWHLMNLDRAEVLFDHSLRLTDAGISGSETRALIFLSIARFLFHARKDYSLAQHCVSLSLTENTRLDSSWLLWSKIATVMGNDKLSLACKNEIQKMKDGTTKQNKPLPSVSNHKINQLLRRAPWQHKIININTEDSWYEANQFPDNFEKSDAAKLD